MFRRWHGGGRGDGAAEYEASPKQPPCADRSPTADEAPAGLDGRSAEPRRPRPRHHRGGDGAARLAAEPRLARGGREGRWMPFIARGPGCGSSARRTPWRRRGLRRAQTVAIPRVPLGPAAATTWQPRVHRARGDAEAPRARRELPERGRRRASPRCRRSGARELMPMDVPRRGVPHVGRCAELESLVLMYCRDTTDAATAHLTGLSKLSKTSTATRPSTDRTRALSAMTRSRRSPSTAAMHDERGIGARAPPAAAQDRRSGRRLTATSRRRPGPRPPCASPRDSGEIIPRRRIVSREPQRRRGERRAFSAALLL